MEYAMAFDKVLKEHGWCCFFEKDAPSNSCQKQLINQLLKGIMPLQLRMHVQAETARLNIRSDKPAFYRTLLTHAQSQNLWHGSTTTTNDHFESKRKREGSTPIEYKPKTKKKKNSQKKPNLCLVCHQPGHKTQDHPGATSEELDAVFHAYREVSLIPDPSLNNSNVDNIIETKKRKPKLEINNELYISINTFCSLSANNVLIDSILQATYLLDSGVINTPYPILSSRIATELDRKVEKLNHTIKCKFPIEMTKVSVEVTGSITCDLELPTTKIDSDPFITRRLE